MTTKTESPVSAILPEDTKPVPVPPEPKEPVVWADDVSPFTGDQVLALLKENEKLREQVDPPEPPRVEAEADTVPGARFVVLQNKHKALRALYDEQALAMAKRIADASVLNAELNAHKAALTHLVDSRRSGKTFDSLMEQALKAGAKHLAFAVTLDDYFPYPSPKTSWVCEAYESDQPITEPIAGGTGRSGEEALRACVVGLPVKKP